LNIFDSGREAVVQTTNLVTIMLLCSALMVLSPSRAGAGDQGVTVGEEQSGQHLTLRVGEVFQVELPGLGGTGYSWYLDNLDSRDLELISQETHSASPARMAGGPLLYRWRFKAKKEGQTELKMAYYRVWEGIGTATKHFLLHITIGPDGR
jgi:predicted secreted protein